MSEITKVVVDKTFDAAENVVENAGVVAQEVVGAGGDVGQAVVDVGRGVGMLTVGEASELALDIMKRLHGIARAGADAIPLP